MAKADNILEAKGKKGYYSKGIRQAFKNSQEKHVINGLKFHKRHFKPSNRAEDKMSFK